MTDTDQPAPAAEANHTLIRDHLGLARHLARRFRGRESPDDLEGVANLALVAAAGRFDPDRGVAFSTYAMVTITGELKRHLRDRSWAIRVPRRLNELSLRLGDARETLGHRLGRSPTLPEMARFLGVGVEDVLEALEAGQAFRAASLDAPLRSDDGPGGSLGDHLVGEEVAPDGRLDLLLLGQLMEELPAAERHLLQRYFFDDWSQAEIGRELGCSQMQVSRHLSQSLRRLRRQI